MRKQQSISRFATRACAAIVSSAMMIGALALGQASSAFADDTTPDPSSTTVTYPQANEQACHPQSNDALDAGVQEVSVYGAQSPEPTVRCAIEGVHTDAIAAYVSDGDNPQLILKSKADSVYKDSQGRLAANGLRYDTDAVAFLLPDKAQYQTTSLPATYNFLKKATNNGAIWYIPQTQDYQVLWAGFSSEALQGNSHVASDAKVTITMQSFRGPGELYMWSNNADGSITPQFGSPDTGYPQTHQLVIPQHEHMNWAFTAAGRYTFTLQASLTIDGKVQTDTQEYVFYVGDGTPTMAASRLSVKSVSASVGSPVTFEATVTSDDFDVMQGWVEFTRLDGTRLGFAKLVNGVAKFAYAGFDEAGNSALKATYIPRFSGDATSVSTTFLVDVSDAVPDSEALADLTALSVAEVAKAESWDSDAWNMEAVGSVAAGSSTVLGMLQDSKVAGSYVYVDVFDEDALAAANAGVTNGDDESANGSDSADGIDDANGSADVAGNSADGNAGGNTSGSADNNAAGDAATNNGSTDNAAADAASGVSDNSATETTDGAASTDAGSSTNTDAADGESSASDNAESGATAGEGNEEGNTTAGEANNSSVTANADSNAVNRDNNASNTANSGSTTSADTSDNVNANNANADNTNSDSDSHAPNTSTTAIPTIFSGWLRVGSNGQLVLPRPLVGKYRVVIRNDADAIIAHSKFIVDNSANLLDEAYLQNAQHQGDHSDGDADTDSVETGAIDSDSAADGHDVNLDANDQSSDANDTADPSNAIQPCTSANMLVLDHGHIDIAAYSPQPNSLKMVIQEDVTGSHVRRNPSNVMLWLRPEAATSRGWSIPQTQRSNLLWLGWNDQFLSNRRTEVTWTINSVNGPGSVHIWTEGNLGAANTTILDSNSKRTFTMAANVHTHANWDFSAQGYYAINMTYSSALGSDTQTIYIAVGNVDPRAMPLPCSVAQNASSTAVAKAPAPAQDAEKSEEEKKTEEEEEAKEKEEAEKKNAAEAERKKKESSSSNANVDDAELMSAGGLYDLFVRHPVLFTLLLAMLGVCVGVFGVLMYALMLKKRAGKQDALEQSGCVK